MDTLIWPWAGLANRRGAKALYVGLRHRFDDALTNRVAAELMGSIRP